MPPLWYIKFIHIDKDVDYVDKQFLFILVSAAHWFILALQHINIFNLVVQVPFIIILKIILAIPIN